MDEHISSTVENPAVWDAITAQAELPCDEKSYFGECGATPMSPDSRRQYRRIRVRGRVRVRLGSQTLGTYTMDVSPVGVGFYSPVQLYPKQRVIVLFDDCNPLEIRITRCRKIRQQCFACGGKFTQGKMPPGAYREFLRILKV